MPKVWLVSDARNDAVLLRAVARLPRGAGVIFRHHHLCGAARRARFAEVARAARARGCLAVVAGDVACARRWGADGAYGPPGALAHGGRILRLVTVHAMRDLRAARRADALVISPVHATRSHPGATTLGAVRWRLLAARAPMPCIALGGMDAARARRLGAARWAAIDGLSPRGA